MLSEEYLVKIRECTENSEKIRDILVKELHNKLINSVDAISECLHLVKEIKDNPVFCDVITVFANENPFQIIVANDMSDKDDADVESAYVMLLEHSIGITEHGDVVKVSSSNIMYDKSVDFYIKDLSEQELMNINMSLNCANMYAHDVILAINEIHDVINMRLQKLVNGIDIDNLYDDSTLEQSEQSTNDDNVDSLDESNDFDNELVNNNVEESEMVEDSVLDDNNDSSVYPSADDSSIVETSDNEFVSDESCLHEDSNSGLEDASDDDAVEFADDIPLHSVESFDEDVSDVDSLIETNNEEEINDTHVNEENMEDTTSHENNISDNVYSKKSPVIISEKSETEYSVKRTEKNRVIPMRVTGNTIVVTIDMDWVPEVKESKFGSYYNVIIPIGDSDKVETASFMLDASKFRRVNDEQVNVMLNNGSHYIVYFSSGKRQNMLCQELLELFKNTGE